MEVQERSSNPVISLLVNPDGRHQEDEINQRITDCGSLGRKKGEHPTTHLNKKVVKKEIQALEEDIKTSDQWERGYNIYREVIKDIICQKMSTVSRNRHEKTNR